MIRSNLCPPGPFLLAKTMVYTYLQLDLQKPTIMSQQLKSIIDTLTYYPDTNNIAIDGQVCFYRRLFADPVKSQKSLWGHWKALLGGMGSQTTPNVHLSSSCDPRPLWLFLSTTEQTAQLPVSTSSCNLSTHPSTHP